MKTIEKSIETKLNIEEEFHTLQNKYALLEQNYEELTAKLNWYEEQFRLSQQRRFGTSSEQTDSNQLSIFNEAKNHVQKRKSQPLKKLHINVKEIKV